jgi:hypothetical protein
MLHGLPRGKGRAVMRILQLAFAYQLQYVVMRCAHLAGHEVHVLGAGHARGFRYSLACSSYHELEHVPGRDALDDIVAEVIHWIGKLGAEAVLPSDALSTRLLIAIADRLPVGTCPLPVASCFDALNDKWQFFEICRNANIRVPRTWLFTSVGEIQAALAERRLGLPLVVKPVDSMAGSGVIFIRDRAGLAQLDICSYSPLLVQRLVPGVDRGISVLAREGKLLAYAVQRRESGTFDFSDNVMLKEMAERLLAVSGFTGVAHFDAREEAETGLIYLLECNPRFWYSMFALAAAGLNMVDIALSTDPARLLAPCERIVDIGRHLARKFLRLRPSRADWWMARYYLRDIPGAIADRRRLFDDNRLGPWDIDSQRALLHELTSACRDEEPSEGSCCAIGVVRETA